MTFEIVRVHWNWLVYYVYCLQVETGLLLSSGARERQMLPSLETFDIS